MGSKLGSSGRGPLPLATGSFSEPRLWFFPHHVSPFFLLLLILHNRSFTSVITGLCNFLSKSSKMTLTLPLLTHCDHMKTHHCSSLLHSWVWPAYAVLSVLMMLVFYFWMNLTRFRSHTYVSDLRKNEMRVSEMAQQVKVLVAKSGTRVQEPHGRRAIPLRHCGLIYMITP